MLFLDHIAEDKQDAGSWPTERAVGPKEDSPMWTSDHVGAEAEATHESDDNGFKVNDSQTNEMLARYLGDVRQFALLSPAEEQALWQRVMYWQSRLCRALYLSPVALPTLINRWHQVQHGDLPLQQLLQLTPPASHDSDWDTDRLQSYVHRLRDLSSRLQRLSQQRRKGTVAPRKQRERRLHCQELWREWLALWNDMPLVPEVQDMIIQALQKALRRHATCPRLRAAHCALTRAQRELEQAKHQMLLANLRLVIYMAKRHQGTHLSFLDLIQEGNTGLMRALERFDPQRGVKFATYACWWIRQTMSRALVNQNETIRVPNHVVERKSKLRQAIVALHQRYQRPPTNQELSAALSWPLYMVEQTRQERRTLRWGNDALPENHLRLDDMVQDDQLAPPDEAIARLELQQCVADSLDTLPKRDAEVLRLRFGLETDRAYTLREIGEKMGLSRERIRQIEKTALAKLRFSVAGASLAEAAGLTTM